MPQDLAGKRFGKLIVISAENQGRKRTWLCRCDCGKESVVLHYSLLSGATRSCGCGSREALCKARTKHGLANSPTWVSWYAMIQRCYHKNHKYYFRYGSAGITVHERYRDPRTGIVNLIADIGERPSAEYSLDRIENRGNYEPGNIRWATKKQQSRNRNDNHFVIHEGQTRTLTEWAEIIGIGATTLRARLKKGWSVEQAFSMPIVPRAERRRVHRER